MATNFSSFHTIRIFGFIAAVIGILQGISWTILSSLAVCIYVGSFALDSADESMYTRIIRVNFLEQDTGKFPEYKILGSEEFSYFTQLYIPTSVIWLIVSCILLKEMVANKFRKNTHIIFILWATITALNSLIDLVLTSLLSRDFYEFNSRESTNELIVLFDEYLIVYGIMLSVAARGYITIVLNIIVTVFIAYYANILRSNSDEIDDSSSSQIIHAYGNPANTIYDQAKFARNQNMNHQFTNQGYQPDDQNFNFSSNYLPMPNSNDNEEPTYDGLFEGSRHNTNTINNNNNNNNYYSNFPQDQRNFNSGSPQRLAKIGRQGRNISPKAVHPPFIPDPDYTPPNTLRGLKSVLRSNSKYNHQS